MAVLTNSNLLPTPEVYQELLTIDYHPCFALMLALTETSQLPAPGYLRFKNGPIASIADNQQKNVSNLPGLTIVASPEFTREHFERSPEQIKNLLLTEVKDYIAGEIEAYSVQRWRFSHPTKTYPDSFFQLATEQPLLLAGDAFGGPRVEGAFLSGLKAAQALIKV